MKEVILSLLTTLLAAVGYGLYQKKKRSQAEGANANLDTQKKLNELDKEKTVDDGASEREKIAEQIVDLNKKELNVKDIIDFLNQFRSDK